MMNSSYVLQIFIDTFFINGSVKEEIIFVNIKEYEKSVKINTHQ